MFVSPKKFPEIGSPGLAWQFQNDQEPMPQPALSAILTMCPFILRAQAFARVPATVPKFQTRWRKGWSIEYSLPLRSFLELLDNIPIYISLAKLSHAKLPHLAARKAGNHAIQQGIQGTPACKTQHYFHLCLEALLITKAQCDLTLL